MTTLDNKARIYLQEWFKYVFGGPCRDQVLACFQNTVLPSVTEHVPGQSDPPRLIFNHVEFSGVSSTIHTNCIQLSGRTRKPPSHDIAHIKIARSQATLVCQARSGVLRRESGTWGGRRIPSLAGLSQLPRSRLLTALHPGRRWPN